MFANILGKNKKEVLDNNTVERISKMNLTEMKAYVNNRMKNFKISENGLIEVMRKLISKNINETFFIEDSTMDSKKIKVFELVILIASSKKVTIVISELIQEFMNIYQKIIVQVDQDNMQIYDSRLKDALINSITTIEKMTLMNKKMNVLGT